MRIKINSTIINITEEEDLCARQESHFFDKKSSKIKPASLLRHIVAFANSDGGEIIIGIKDDKEEIAVSKRWDGMNSIEDFNPIFQCISELNPSVDYTATFIKSARNQSYALQLMIEKSHSVHSTLDGDVYIRNSAQTVIVKSHRRIQELSFEKGESSYEDAFVKEAMTEDVTESNELKRFLTDYSSNTHPLDFVVKTNLVNRNSLEPKVAALLLFSNCPADIVPTKCNVKIIRYTTDSDAPLRDHLKEIITVEGPLYLQIEKSMSEVQRIMKTVKYWDLDGELQMMEYPFETLWELLVNAIIHRDYSISDDVQVLIFDNRIEIISPGKLPGRVTVSNIMNMSFARNPKIVRTLNRYKNPPNKDIGEGIKTAFQKMAEFNLQQPSIAEDGNYVRVKIPHVLLATPEEMVLEYLKDNPTITNGKLRSLIGTESENKVRDIFKRLADKNLITRVHGLIGRAAAWTLNHKPSQKEIADEGKIKE